MINLFSKFSIKNETMSRIWTVFMFLSHAFLIMHDHIEFCNNISLPRNGLISSDGALNRMNGLMEVC